MNECEHKDFEASVTINRLEDVTRFVADVRISCLECKIPFRFLGLPAGLHLELPSVSIDATEVRLPIAPLQEEKTK